MRGLAAWLAAGIVLAAGAALGQPGHPEVGTVAAGDGTIRGRVVSADRPADAAGVQVLLYALRAGGTPGITRASTDAEGGFRFSGISTDPDVSYLLGVQAGEIPVGARATFAPGQKELEVELRIEEPSEDTAAAQTESSTLRIERSCSGLRVTETHQIRNPTQRVLYVSSDRRSEGTPILHAGIPTPATGFQVALGILREGLELGEGGLRYWGPLHPGNQTLEFSYTLPVEGDTLRLERGFPDGAREVVFLTHPRGPQVRAERLQPVAERLVQGRRYRAVAAADLAAGERLSLAIELPPSPSAGLSMVATELHLELDDAALEAQEQHRIRVEGNAPLVADSDAPLLCLSLPEGADEVRFSNESIAMGIAPDSPGVLAIRGPIPPGESTVAVGYQIAVQGDRTTFARSFPLPLPLLGVILADTGVEVGTTRLHRRRPIRTRERSYLHLEAFAIDPGERVEIQLARLMPRRRVSTLASVGFAALVAAAALGFLVTPLRRASEEGETGESPAEQLTAEREAVYATIRDLDDDYETGKLTAEDHGELRRELRSQAIRLLQAEREAGARPAASPVRPPVPPPVAPAATPSPARAREAAPTAWSFCPGCGGELPQQARFCPFCGERLAAGKDAG
jgi:hypothetical protein